MVISAQEFQQKHARNLKAAVPEIKAKILALQVNPCELAAAQKDKMLAGITEAVTSGKWGDNLKAVPLDEWKRKTGELGTARIAGGIDAAASKVTAFANQLIPYTEAVKMKCKALPGLTLEDSISRATTCIREMAKFRFRKAG